MKSYGYLVLCLTVMSATACREAKRYHDTVPATADIKSGSVRAEAIEFQATMNQMFRNPETSPLPDRYRKDFQQLEFFEPDSVYRVKAHYVRTPEAQPFLMPTTTDRKAREVRHGIAYFTLKGSAYQLEVYQSMEEDAGNRDKEELFLPFLDNTNGESTYAGGRYLDLPIPDGDTLVIDFNRAYNPYCAYNKKYSCPIVPRANYLDTEVRAGVMAFRAPE